MRHNILKVLSLLMLSAVFASAAESPTECKQCPTKKVERLWGMFDGSMKFDSREVHSVEADTVITKSGTVISNTVVSVTGDDFGPFDCATEMFAAINYAAAGGLDNAYNSLMSTYATQYTINETDPGHAFSINADNGHIKVNVTLEGNTLTHIYDEVHPPIPPEIYQKDLVYTTETVTVTPEGITVAKSNHHYTDSIQIRGEYWSSSTLSLHPSMFRLHIVADPGELVEITTEETPSDDANHTPYPVNRTFPPAYDPASNPMFGAAQLSPAAATAQGFNLENNGTFNSAASGTTIFKFDKNQNLSSMTVPGQGTFDGPPAGGSHDQGSGFRAGSAITGSTKGSYTIVGNGRVQHTPWQRNTAMVGKVFYLSGGGTANIQTPLRLKIATHNDICTSCALGHEKATPYYYQIHTGPSPMGGSSGSLIFYPFLDGARYGTPEQNGVDAECASHPNHLFYDRNGLVLDDATATLKLISTGPEVRTINSYLATTYVTNTMGQTEISMCQPGGNTPFARWSIARSAGTLTITRSLPGPTSVTTYSYSGGNQVYSRTDEQVTSVVTIAGNVATETITARNGANQISSKTRIDYQAVGSSTLMPIAQVLDPDGAAQTTTFEYYGNGRIYQVVGPTGKWFRYLYEGNQVGDIVTGKDNAAPNSPNSSWITTTYGYAPLPGDQAPNDVSPRSVIRYLGNTVIQAQYKIVYANRITEIECVNPNDAYTSPNNRVTTTWLCTEGAVWTHGRPRKIEYPDGTRAVYTYDLIRKDAVAITITKGQPDPANPVGIISGTRTIEIRRPYGRLISSTTYDLDTEVVVGQDLNGDFDDNDHPQTASSLDGTVTQVTYSCCGPESFTYPDGTSRLLGYDSRKRVQTDTFYRGSETTTLFYTYDADNNMLSIQRTEAGGVNNYSVMEAQATYDLAGRITTLIDADNQTTTYAYSVVSGQPVITTTYPNGATQVATFYKDTSLQSLTGTGQTPRYFESGIEPINNITRIYSKAFAANAVGQPTTLWGKHNFDAVLRTIQTSSSADTKTDYTYNVKSQLTSRAPQYFAKTMYTYNARGEQEYAVRDLQGDGQLHLDLNPALHSTTLVESGEIVSRQYTFKTPNSAAETLLEEQRVTPNGFSATHKRYNNGVAIVTQQTLSYNPTTKTYTATQTLPDNTYQVTVSTLGLTTSQTTYNATGAINQVTYTYDHGRLKTVTDSLLGTTTYNYFNSGRLQNVISVAPTPGDPQQTTSYAYNNLGQVSKTTLPDNSTITNEYHLSGKLAKVSGSQTPSTGFGYDLYGRCTRMTNWSATGEQITQYNYDPTTGRLTTMVYPDGKTVTQNANPATRTFTSLDANGITKTVNLTTAGTINTITYANGDASPLVLTYGYDRRGRTTSLIQSGDGTTSWTYDDIGNITSETASTGVVATYQPNALGVITSKTFTRSGVTLAQINTTYGDLLRPQTITQGTLTGTIDYADTSLTKGLALSQGGTLRAYQTKVFDKLGRLTSITTTTNSVAVDSHTYSFTGLNQRSRDTRADGSRWDYGYDTLGQLTNAQAFKADASASLDGQAGYAYDAIGNPIARRDNTLSGLYGSTTALADTFDSNNQLVTKALTPTFLISGSVAPGANVSLSNSPAVRNGEEYQFALPLNYAANANKTVKYQVVGTLSTPTTEVATTNLVSLFTPPAASATFAYDDNGNLTSDDRWIYTWNKRNELITMLSKPDVNNVQYKSVFAYDSLGRRKSRVMSTFSGGTWTVTDNRVFAYDGWKLAAELNGTTYVAIRTYAWAGTRLLWVNDAANGDYFPVYDGNGNVTRLLSATTSAVLASYEYGPFGNLRRAEGPLALINPIRFSGEYQDPTGLIYYGLRYYSPNLGRWINRDPIGTQGGPNLYAMVGNDPINQQDYLGLVGLVGMYPFPDLEEVDPRSTMERIMRGGQYYGHSYMDGVEGFMDRHFYGFPLRNLMEAALASPGAIIAAPADMQDGIERFCKETSVKGKALGAGQTVLAGLSILPVKVKLKGPKPAQNLLPYNTRKLLPPPLPVGLDAAKVTPNPRTGVGYGVTDPPVRIQGTWTEADFRAALQGRPPPSLGRPDLHHAGQMPGSAIHEVLPDVHRGNPALHCNRFNQGVTPQMRNQDRQLHWWYRAREQGADQLYPDLIYDP